MKNNKKIIERNYKMTKTLKHEEPLEELIQIGPEFSQDLLEGINVRTEQLLEENGIDPDDVEEIQSNVSVNIIIIYKKKKEDEE
jgi:hypothetical protein